MENIGKKFRKKESEAETIARMNRQNKEAAQRLRDKKKPRDDKAEGGITSAIKKIKRRFGKKSITTANKIKRPGNRQLFEEFNKRNR
jgi:ABC-type Fe3+-hydroxamate transport system substrate-binding protein